MQQVKVVNHPDLQDGFGKVWNHSLLAKMIEEEIISHCSCFVNRHVTVGQLTDCNKCELPQGQLCGDCLYTRYGENVTEANFNPKWTCPSCREICNCNSCRRRNGWMPTGNIYNKVTKLGFKSVAHYLIKTCRTEKSMKNSVAENIVAQETPETSPDSTLNRPIRTRRALRS
ncbi:uncharacterized protein [Cicer arietinum]|uniref:Cell division cycle-associated 7-like protein isoform X2 n=1 Tax=Cicer arietinum TaxID=3827 RepID=A0A3Q7YEG5_CICAR|nr:cell division cycle-associated 7-like protein isoform X2 [Cicer arietinum]